MSVSDTLISELNALNHNWRIAKNDSIMSESDFPINKIKSSEVSSNEPRTSNYTQSLCRYNFWNESEIEIDESYRDAEELKHQKPSSWSQMTEEQKVMKRKEWKMEDSFYYQRLPVDPIRKAFIDDWRNMNSGAEIWCPR